MVLASTRSDILVEEHDTGATLTLLARNPLVSWVVSTVGGFASLWTMMLVAYGFAISNYLTVLVMTALTAAVFWLTWHIGWRPRSFQIAFTRDSLHVGPHRFAYSEIQSHGLSKHGGDVVDPVSMGAPRNVTIGTHIYVETGERHVPITVGMKDAQAEEAHRLFGHLLDKHRSA